MDDHPVDATGARCAVCLGPAPPGSARCYCCATVARQLGSPLAPVVAIAPYRVGDALHRRLRGYKDAPVADQRRAHAAALARLVRRWWARSVRSPGPGGPLAHHAPAGPGERQRSSTGGPFGGPFVGPFVGPFGGRWDAVATVPSSGRPTGAPVDAVVAMVPELARFPRYRLVRGPDPVDHLVASVRGFVLAGGAPPEPTPAPTPPARVLVVDDSLTTGARAQSAAATLRRAGIPVAGVLVIGHCLHPEATPWHAAYWQDSAGRRAWAAAACAGTSQ